MPAHIISFLTMPSSLFAPVIMAPTDGSVVAGYTVDVYGISNPSIVSVVNDDFSTDTSANYSFTPGVWAITGGRLNNNTSNNPDLAILNAPPFVNGSIQATINNSDWDKKQVAVRLRNGNSNLDSITVEIDGRTGVNIIAVFDEFGGVYVNDGAVMSIAPPGNNTDHIFKVSVNGPTVSVYWDGSLLGTRKTEVVAAGTAAMAVGTWTTAANVQFDNLTVTDFQSQVGVYVDNVLRSTVSTDALGQWYAPGVSLGNVTADSFTVDDLFDYTTNDGPWTISGGRLNNAGTVNDFAYAIRNTPTFADGSVQSIVNSAIWNNRTIDFRIRHTDLNNAILVQVNGQSGTNYVTVYDHIGGSFNVLGAPQMPISAPVDGADHLLKVDVQGATVSVYWDGSLLGTRTTSILIAGQAAVGGYVFTAGFNIQFDDLFILNRDSPTSVFKATNAVGISPIVTVTSGTPSAISFAALGDSITANPGFGCTSWPEVLLSLLPAGSTKNNQAVSGYTTTQMLPLFESNIRFAGAQWLAMLAGTNDSRLGTVTKEQTIANLRQMWSEASAAGMKVVAITITPHKGESYGMWSSLIQSEMDYVNGLIRFDARTLGYHLIDAYDLFGSLNDPQILNSAYANADGIHLNQDGENYLSSLVKAVINP